GTRTNHCVACVVVSEIFITDGAGWDEPIGARFAQFHEKARACHTRDATFEARTDAIGEKMRDQAVIGLPLGQHRPPLGSRDLRGAFSQGFLVRVLRQTILAELERPYEPTMDDQVGVAPDW